MHLSRCFIGPTGGMPALDVLQATKIPGHFQNWSLSPQFALTLNSTECVSIAHGIVAFQQILFKGTSKNSLFPRLRRQLRARTLVHPLYTAVLRAALPCTDEEIRIFRAALKTAIRVVRIATCCDTQPCCPKKIRCRLDAQIENLTAGSAHYRNRRVPRGSRTSPLSTRPTRLGDADRAILRPRALAGQALPPSRSKPLARSQGYALAHSSSCIACTRRSCRQSRSRRQPRRQPRGTLNNNVASIPPISPQTAAAKVNGRPGT